MSAALKQSENRSRANLRLDANIWEAIDQARNRRAGFISRNTWVMEAVLEKLAREQPNNGLNERTRGRDV